MHCWLTAELSWSKWMNNANIAMATVVVAAVVVGGGVLSWML